MCFFFKDSGPFWHIFEAILTVLKFAEFVYKVYKCKHRKFVKKIENGFTALFRKIIET